jgi:hypothetical protein
VLFRAYIDDSTEETARIFTVGGFAASNESWEQLEPSWLDFLEQLKLKGISYFHATDCFSGANEFKGIFSPAREAILDRVLALVLKHKLRLIGYGLDEDAYKKFAPKPKRNDFGTNRYVAAFEGAIQSACESFNTSQPFENSTGDICDFYIENSDYKPSAAEAIQRFKNDGMIWFRDRIGNDVYGDKKGPHAIPLLQVGDFGAFLANKHLIKAKDGRIPWAKYYNQLYEARLIWPIRKWDAHVLAILRGVQGLPELTDDDF